MTKYKEGHWYIYCDNAAGRHMLRGPYRYIESAGAVRSEMERNENFDRLNLCIGRFPPGTKKAARARKVQAQTRKAMRRSVAQLHRIVCAKTES